MEEYSLFTDGGSRGNPGIAACGFLLTDGDGKELLSGGWYLGENTNNHAEYCGLIWGLQNAKSLGIKNLKIYADSELMVKQVNGVYKVKNAHLKDMHAQANELFSSFESITISHIYRTANKVADLRVNESMDAKAPVGSYKVDFFEGSAQATLF